MRLNFQEQLKTFVRAMKLFPHDPKKAKAFLKDKRLTIAEKAIIDGWLMLRDCQYTQLIKKMEELKTDNKLVYMEAQLLKGIALNNTGECNRADVCLKQCLEELKQYNLVHQMFLANYNLFIVALNRMNLIEMRSHLQEMKCLSQGTKDQNLSIVFADFSISVVKQDHKKFLELVSKLDNQRDSMSENMVYSYHILKFNYFIIVKDEKSVGDVLDDIKQFRKFHLSSNFKFMRGLSDFYFTNKPIYLYEKDFQDVPILYFQMKVLKNLEAEETFEAELAWAKLMDLYPEIYYPQFTYRGFTCLFSLCLEKLKSTIFTDFNLEIDYSMKKEEIMLYVLSNLKRPIKKELLYELVWRRPPESKDDFNKFTTMLFKVKENFGLNIQMRKGCYRLILDESKDKKVA